MKIFSVNFKKNYKKSCIFTCKHSKIEVRKHKKLKKSALTLLKNRATGKNFKSEFKKVTKIDWVKGLIVRGFFLKWPIEKGDFFDFYFTTFLEPRPLDYAILGPGQNLVFLIKKIDKNTTGGRPNKFRILLTILLKLKNLIKASKRTDSCKSLINKASKIYWRAHG